MDAKSVEALASFRAGRLDQAEAQYRDIARRSPNDGEAQRMIGILCSQAGRHAEALEHFDRALRLNRKQPAILYNSGISLLALRRVAEALDSFDRALAIGGPDADAYVNRGIALRELRRMSEAVASCDRAIQLSPMHFVAHANKANALADLGRLEEALASYDNSLNIRATSGAWAGRGAVLKLLGRFDDALAAMQQSHRLEPSRPYLQGEIFHLKMQLGDWDNFAQDCALLLGNVDQGLRATIPGHLLAAPASLEQQQCAAQTFARDRFPGESAPLPAARSASTGKITVGYFSGDFHNHAVAYLAVGLFEEHDRDNFTIIGFSYGEQRDDEYARRIGRGMDRFIDVSAKSDSEIADLSRSLGVDIAVDLSGPASNGRLGIFAHRAAPVQATYLGVPVTTGCSFFDHIIADEIVIPEEDDQFFTEPVFRLPVSFQVNDSRRPPVQEMGDRAAHGLPEHGFVFCCFNNGYKLTPDVFAIWMRLLRRVEGSVLWLVADSATFVRNLRKYAGQQGVEPERLVFAERVSVHEYLARQRCADLALDTFHFNGGTTGSDTLWAGLPMVTRLGATFAGRMGASLLQAIGLPDLIARTSEEYEELAFRLATEKYLLASVRRRLERNRATSSLFDTASFARRLEAAYREMIERHWAGSLAR